MHIGFPSKWTSVTKLFENSHLEGFSSWITVRSYNQNAVSLWYVNFLISCLLKHQSLIYHSVLGQLQQEGIFVVLPTTVVQILTELNFLKCVCPPWVKFWWNVMKSVLKVFSNDKQQFKSVESYCLSVNQGDGSEMQRIFICVLDLRRSNAVWIYEWLYFIFVYDCGDFSAFVL